MEVDIRKEALIVRGALHLIITAALRFVDYNDGMTLKMSAYRL
jgi:hypothetical protein